MRNVPDTRVHPDAGEQQAERHGNDGLVLLLAPRPTNEQNVKR